MNNVNEPHLENIARTPRFPCHIWVYQYSRGGVFVKKRRDSGLHCQNDIPMNKVSEKFEIECEFKNK